MPISQSRVGKGEQVDIQVGTQSAGHGGDAAAIADAIRRTRREAGLTQEQLAQLAGTSERTVRAMETGAGNPSLQAVVAVANVLGLKLAVQ